MSALLQGFDISNDGAVAEEMPKRRRGHLAVEYYALLGLPGAQIRLARDVSVLEIFKDKVRLGQIYLNIRKSFYVDYDVIVQDALVFDVKLFTGVTDSWSIDALLGYEIYIVFHVDYEYHVAWVEDSVVHSGLFVSNIFQPLGEVLVLYP